MAFASIKLASGLCQWPRRLTAGGPSGVASAWLSGGWKLLDLSRVGPAQNLVPITNA